MIKRWWHVKSWKIEPEPIMVVSSTEKTITYDNGHRLTKALKHSDGEDYFPTWKEARQFVIDRERTRRERAAELMLQAAHRVRDAIELPEEEPA